MEYVNSSKYMELFVRISFLVFYVLAPQNKCFRIKRKGMEADKKPRIILTCFD